MAAVLLAAAPRHAPPTAYSAPSGKRPAGASAGSRVDAILPDGRIAAPAGAAIFVGTNPEGVALSRDGRWAVVSNDEQDPAAPSPLAPGAGALVPGYSLAVVDTRTMRVTSVYQAPGITFFKGIAVVDDPARPGSTIVLASDGGANAIRVFDLSAGGVLGAQPAAIPLPNAYPASIDVAADGRTAYVAGNLGGTVAAIDIANRRVLDTVPVGYFPFDVALAGSHVFVTNSGLSAYPALSSPVHSPQFRNPSGDLNKSSSLSVLDLAAGGDIAAGSGTTVRMDPIPDGISTIGGARPGAIVVRRDARYAYVALSNVDRVATIALGANPHVVAGLDLRLFINAPYGTQPSSEVLSRDGKRLYVALAGLNAVAVLDARTPAKLHRLGLIPTGWYPSALALSPDGRYLYVTSAKGVDGWGLLQRIDMKTLPLVKVTLSALRYNRAVAAAHVNPVVPTIRSHARSSVIDRVVYISVGRGTFDATLGENAPPNLGALAKTYGLADNFYVNDMNPDANVQFALGGMASLYAERTLRVNAGRSPLDAHGNDPEDYPREGFVFNAAARAGLSFRDYGGMLQLSGYQPSTAEAPRRGRSTPTPTPPLGGVYTLDLPALAALDGHADLNYPGWNPQITDTSRAAEFISDMGRLVQAGGEPAFTYVWLPTAPGAQGVADADRALGQIVEFLSQTPHWSSTALFIVPDGIDGGSDHINRARSYAVVVSPVCKRGYVGHAHLSVASVVKTEEELLGLPPLALPDLLATDMADFFGTTPYPLTYHALP